MRYKTELLAPAGDAKIFKAAIDAGADAVYCGIDLFNARLNASNLTMDELSECVAYAHERSASVYLTLNTIVNDDEIDLAVNVARDAYDVGVDAILIQDIGLAVRIHQKYPNIPLHASTQMNVWGKDKIDSLKGKGFTRIVLPRELSLKEIESYTNYASKKNLQTEVFIHGAVCICTSGLCQFSAMNKSGSRSGNRGICAQPCRKEYELINSGRTVSKGHLISPKDRGLIRYIPSLIDAGVASLKIEGRMRDEVYVRTAVSCYRRIIDSYYDGSLTDDLLEEIENELLVNFNRGGSFTDQNMSGRKSDSILSGEYVGKYGLKIGKVTLRDCKEGTITIRPCKGAIEPSKGDYLSLRTDDKEIKSFPVGKSSMFKDSFVIKGLHPDSIKNLPDNVSVYLMNHEFATVKNAGKTHIDITFDSSEDGVIKASALVNSGVYEGVFAQDELNYDFDESRNSLLASRVEEQLKKTGNTAFAVDSVYVEDPCTAKCPISLINELRRGLLETLSSEILSEGSHSADEEFFIGDVEEEREEGNGSVTTLRYYPSLSTLTSEYRDADIYAFSAYDYMNPKYRDEIDELIDITGKKLMIVMPDFCHEDKFEAFKSKIDAEVMPTAGANIYNAESLKTNLKEKGGAFISYELMQAEAIEMLKKNNVPGKVYLHCGGLIPWMQSDFCPVGRNSKNCGKCANKGVFNLMQDNGEKDLTVVTHPYDCSSIIYGPAKAIFDDKDCHDIADLGYDVIKCYTEV